MEGSLKTLKKFEIRNRGQIPTPEIGASSFHYGGDLPKGAKINRYCQLPEEIVEEILLRLPADSLKTCKRVCKSWFNITNDPSFVDKHLFRITSENSKPSSSRTIFLKWIRQELLLDDIFGSHSVFHKYGNDLSKLVLSLVTISEDDIDGNDSDQLRCVVEQVSLPPIPEADQPYFPTNLKASHCNGIIHMADQDNEWLGVLLNPILREFKLVQTENLLPHDFFISRGMRCDFGPFLVGSGFGYDPKANVYKYVMVFGNYKYMFPVAAVYTMGSDDSWRLINFRVNANVCYFRSKGVYCKGAYYWWNVACIVETILSFDMSEEKFRSIPLPKQLYGTSKKLEVLKESVILFSSVECSWLSSIFEVWVLVDNFGGVEGSPYWTKHLTIGPLQCIHFPLAFWKDDELLLETRDGRIVSYNIHTQKLRNVPLPGAMYPGLTYASLCLKSLVSV